jgi:hypothetical protein
VAADDTAPTAIACPVNCTSPSATAQTSDALVAPLDNRDGSVCSALPRIDTLHVEASGMNSGIVTLTYEGFETLMVHVAERLDRHGEVALILALNGVAATGVDVRHALQAASVCIDRRGGITIRPCGEGHQILIPIAKYVADAIDEELGESVMFTMQS